MGREKIPISDIQAWIDSLYSLLPWLSVGVVVVSLLTLAAVVARRYLSIKYLLRQKYGLIEITPPAQTDKAKDATQKLFTVLHGLASSRSWRDALLDRRVVISFEVVSTLDQGIRFIVQVNKTYIDTFKQAISSYLPDSKVKNIDEYIKVSPGQSVKVAEVVQRGHFAYPLNIQGLIEDHDPMAYLAGSMTKLADGEMIVLQFVASPVKVREAASIAERILYNEELLHQLGRRRFTLLGKALGAINTVLFSVIDGISDVFSHSSPNGYRAQGAGAAHRQQVAARVKPARNLSAFEQKLAESVHDKVGQPLFSVTIRALIVTKDEHRQIHRIQSIRDWMALFSVPRYQSLRIRRDLDMRRLREYKLFAFRHRLPAVLNRHSSILSASEMADLYHFPHSQTGRTENAIKSLSKTLPAPISLKGNNNFDIRLGENIYHGTKTPIGLNAAERERHIYIVGGTGNGKTTIMLYSMIQDLQGDKGFAFIDPHGDAAETLLKYVPEDRVDDVIYFNPDDLAYPVGLNLLELPDGLSGDDLLREKDLITESTISVFRKIFSEDDSGGHRIEYVLRNAVQTALTIEGSTLFTIFRLLNNAKYRKKIVAKLEDEDLKNFWKNELGRAGDFQRVKMSAGITAKVGRFLFSASAKRILEQPKSTIDFDGILNDGKVLVCNFSKGLLGEDTSELFGTTVLAKLQMAALRRARIKQAERRPFYLYVDEFQNFATMSFVQMLSEARKYKLCLMMAEQSTSQQDDRRMVDIILANVGTVITFRTGNPADEKYLLPLYSPYLQNGDIANLPTFNYYIRLAAIRSQEPFSGHTIVPDDCTDESRLNQVIETSRQNHAIDKSKSIKTTESPKVKSKKLQAMRKPVALPGD